MNSATQTPKRPLVTLVAVCAAIVLVPIVATGASVALPGISSDLNAGLSSTQWVVNAFFLTFASFMALTGSLADMIGRRTMFTVGLATFCASMIFASAAPDITVLIIARVIAGVGAAAVTTGGSAVLAHTFTGAARARAFAAFGTAIGLGLAFGPLIAGALVTSLGGWRVFSLSAALVLLPVLAISFLLVNSRDPHPAGIDWYGAGTFTASLSLFVFAVVEGPSLGWHHPDVIGAFLAAVILFLVFTRCENLAEHPLIDLSLFREPRFVAICILPILLAFGFVALLILLPPYFMAVDSMTAQSAGLLLVLLTGPTLILPLVTGALVQRIPERVLLIAIVALLAVGSAWLTIVEPHSGPATLAAPLITLGSGFGISLAILDGAAVSSVESSRAGMAAGVFNTMRLGGESISIAALGAVISAVTASELDRAVSGDDTADVTDKVLQGDMNSAVTGLADPDAMRSFAEHAYTSGLHAALWTICALSVLGIAVVGLLTRKPTLSTGSNATTPAPAAADAHV